jgi:hypothetical protein
MSSFATVVPPPPLVSPEPDAPVATPSEALFTWSAVAGANEYVLQISRDPLFQPVSTRSYVRQSGATDGTELSTIVNVAQDLPPSSSGTTVLFWRVGARNLHDLIAPRTDPGLTQLYPQDQGYVWSTPGSSSFTITSVAAAAAAAGRRGPRPLRILGPRP